ncbi:MAG TPA: hypothetical protein VFN39_01490, partial [Gemmatimonadaceae bacterium]|nr:hypothetical protein [Gemmatimonadaceae bacterium]
MSLVVSTLLVQAVGALFTGVVFAHFQRVFQHGYLRHWTRAWFAAGVMLVAVAGSSMLRDAGVSSGPLYVALGIVSMSTALFRVLWLVFGSYEITFHREIDPAWQRRLVAASVVVGVALPLIVIGAGAELPAPLPTLVRTIVRTALSAAAFAIAAR